MPQKCANDCTEFTINIKIYTENGHKKPHIINVYKFIIATTIYICKNNKTYKKYKNSCVAFVMSSRKKQTSPKTS